MPYSINCFQTFHCNQFGVYSNCIYKYMLHVNLIYVFTRLAQIYIIVVKLITVHIQSKRITSFAQFRINTFIFATYAIQVCSNVQLYNQALYLLQMGGDWSVEKYSYLSFIFYILINSTSFLFLFPVYDVFCKQRECINSLMLSLSLFFIAYDCFGSFFGFLLME